MHTTLLAVCFGLSVCLALLSGCNQSGSSSYPTRTAKSSVAAGRTASASEPAESPESEPATASDTKPATEPASAAEPPTDEAKPADEARRGEPAAARPVQKLADPDARALTMPQVVLSHAQSELCKVKVGDQLPDVQLPNLDGQTNNLGKLLGSKLTVVVFWGSASRSSVQEIGDLASGIVKRYGDFGVAAVGINVGDEAAQAKALAKSAGAGFTMLADRDVEALRSIGPPRPPVTYLVDPSLKVLWFDIEYSNTTRRDLEQAIRYALAHE